MEQGLHGVWTRLGSSGTGKSTLINYLFRSERFADMEIKSKNRHDVAITWLDSKMDSEDRRTESLLNQLNDRVQLFNSANECINYLYRCQETTLFIISGKCAKEHLRAIHSCSSIDSIIIYCASPEKYYHLINDSYSKILACVASEIELIQCVHHWIDLKCQTHFYTCYSPNDYALQLTRQLALFLANFVLAHCIEYLGDKRHKEDMVKICQTNYAQHSLEFEHIREFELTYTPVDAIHWYTRNSFVYKIVNRTLRSFDSVKLRAIAFYIRDLRSELQKWHSKTLLKQIKTVYHGLAMIQADVYRIQSMPKGSFVSTNGFLSTSRRREIALAFATEKQNNLRQPLVNVLLEINIDVENSPIIFADIASLSAFPDEGEVLFDLGAMFHLQNVIYDKEGDTDLHIIQLSLATQDHYDTIKQSLKMIEYKLDEQLDNSENDSLIGKLLNVENSLHEQRKKSDDYGQTFSLFRTAFNTLWSASHDKCRCFFDESMSLMTKIRQLFNNQYNRTEKPNNSTKVDLDHYEEVILAKFEPILFFHLDDQLMKEERTNLSAVFQWQYRRFITEHLTLAEMDENLEEYRCIYYVSSELPLFMKENPRIKFYQLQWPSEDQSGDLVKIKVMERLRSQLLHELGMSYSEQLESLRTDKDNQSVTRALRKKAAKCYERLAEENEKIIQRYQDI